MGADSQGGEEVNYPPRRAGFGRPVFGIDIDGTLGDYHGHFLRFASGWLGREIPEFAGGSLHSHMGVSKATYRQIKLAYRRGGLKRSMPVYEGAPEMVASLRKRGAVIVICTTRPYLQLDNLEPDTREFLRRNRIPHDSILSGEHKYRDLKAIYGKEHVVSVLDDLPEMCRQAENSGLPWVLRAQPWNEDTDWPTTYLGCYTGDLNMAGKVLHSRLNEWEVRNRG